MKVGIIGSGDVAQALGRGFASRGHDVMLGSREPNSEKLEGWKKKTSGKVGTGTVLQAARHGEVVVLSVHGKAAEAAIEAAGRENLEGKLVIDTTNPLEMSEGLPPGLFVGVTDSLGERVQKMLPRSHVVKAFNTIASIQMVDPKFPASSSPPMMICGNDAKAKTQVDGIVRSFGWSGTLDLGGIEMSRWMEAFVPLWVTVGRKLGTWHHVAEWVHP